MSKSKPTQKELIEDLTARLRLLEYYKWEQDQKLKYKCIDVIWKYRDSIDVFFKTPWYEFLGWGRKKSFKTECCYETFMDAKGWQNL